MPDYPFLSHAGLRWIYCDSFEASCIYCLIFPLSPPRSPVRLNLPRSLSSPAKLTLPKSPSIPAKLTFPRASTLQRAQSSWRYSHSTNSQCLHRVPSLQRPLCPQLILSPQSSQSQTLQQFHRLWTSCSNSRAGLRQSRAFNWVARDIDTSTPPVFEGVSLAPVWMVPRLSLWTLPPVWMVSGSYTWTLLWTGESQGHLSELLSSLWMCPGPLLDYYFFSVCLGPRKLLSVFDLLVFVCLCALHPLVFPLCPLELGSFMGCQGPSFREGVLW